MTRKLTAIIEREGDGYVALCPEVDVASQGATIDEARKNIKEALELFFETASAEEINTRLHEEVYVTHVENGSCAGLQRNANRHFALDHTSIRCPAL